MAANATEPMTIPTIAPAFKLSSLSSLLEKHLDESRYKQVESR